MSDDSRIEWTNATWNPVVGCSKVSEGCRHCYAMKVAHRNAAMGSERYKGLTEKRSSGVEWNGAIRTVPQILDQPLRWKRPRKIFVNSMSDLFHPDVPFEFIRDVFLVMGKAHQHTFQILTKRPERMLEWFQWMPGYGDAMRGGESMTTHEEILPWPLPNVWLGVSVENQQTADERIPLLLQVPAAVRWLSMEPLLGPMNIQQYLYNTITSFTPTSVSLLTDGTVGLNGNVNDMTPRLNWVVVGGESGPKARPMHPDWARSLRDQCTAAGVPFFFKQWGEWKPVHHVDDPDWCTDIEGSLAIMDAKGFRWEDEDFQPTTDAMPTCWEFQRIGKKASGRLLDGRTWDEMPKVSSC